MEPLHATQRKIPANRIPDLLTAEDVKRILGLKSRTNHTLRDLEIRGILHPVRITSKMLRYLPEDIAKLLEDGRSA